MMADKKDADSIHILEKGDDHETGHHEGEVEHADAYIPKVTTDLHEPDIKKKTIISSRPITTTRRAWLVCTWCITGWIPSIVLEKCCKMQREDVRIAWREKIALCFIIFLMCALLLFFIIGIGLIVCPDRHVLSQGEIDGRNSLNQPYVSMYGSYYRIPDIVQSHVYANQWLNAQAMQDTTLGHDVSPMFFKIDNWARYCPGIPKAQGWDNINRNVPENAINVWIFHRNKDANGQPKDYIASISKMRRGNLARDTGWISGHLADDPQNNRIIVAYGKVYDFTTYLDASNKNNFLGPNIKKIVQNYGQTGKDSTALFEEVKRAEGVDQWRRYMNCMDGLLYIGLVDRRLDPSCLFANYILLASTIIMVSVIGFKFLAALSFTGKKSPEKYDKHVLLIVPCYTEGSDSLKKTIDSLALAKYDERSKLLFIIADGMITGTGNDKPTPEIALDVLGWEGDRNTAEPRAYQAVGEGMNQLNFAKVYSGFYYIQGQNVPYIVVVKCGSELETSKPGNRGKRDSQLILMQFLSRVHFDSDMCPLDLELAIHIHTVLDLDPGAFEYALFVDADTDIAPDSLNRLVACMINDASIMGLCGETSIKNEMASWVTAIQVYEYFISHAMAKAFESMFGTVTCLPGCFSMYRIKLVNRNLPVLVAKEVLKDYSENTVDTLHKRNLLSLGEDRWLTTILLKRFPAFKTCYTADAKCKTVAPDKWNVFLSQRRRWINSTVHNLLELLLLPDMCGFCLFSMRFVIALDLFATVVAPCSLIYIGYLVYSILTDDTVSIPLVSLIMIGAIYGLQVIIFLLKREWQHLGWMIIYILAMPIYSFFLPLYSFWHMDNFSWGKTRTIMSEDGAEMITESTETFDPEIIPRMKWSTFLSEWQGQPQEALECDGTKEDYYDRDVDEDDVVWSGSYPSDEEIRAHIQTILDDAKHAASVSESAILHELKQFYGFDFSARRGYIGKCIAVYRQQKSNGSE